MQPTPETIDAEQFKNVMASIPEIKTRVILCVLALLAVALPLVSVSPGGMGLSVGVSLTTIVGSVAYLLPLAFIAQLLVPAHPQSRAYTLIVDGLAAGSALLVAACLAYQAISAVMQVNEMQRQLGAFGMPNMHTPSLFSMVDALPGLGGIAMIALAVWSGIRLVRVVKSIRAA